MAKYEKRYFNNDEKVWMGTYRNLTNILHWHSECELIEIVEGLAQIKIGNALFEAKQGDVFFCSSKELHYIMSKGDTLINIVIFHEELLYKITTKYYVFPALLCNSRQVKEKINCIQKMRAIKPRFYSETLENYAKDILLDIFNNNKIHLRQIETSANKRIIDKIHNEFLTITFDEMVSFSGYSSSYFSKTFKKLTGMTFSDYLNCLKIEYAVILLQSNADLTVTDICYKCGFSTIRNFNRVFKQITGFAPRDLPNDFTTNLNISIYTKDKFNPTSQTSMLL